MYISELIPKDGDMQRAISPSCVGLDLIGKVYWKEESARKDRTHRGRTGPLVAGQDPQLATAA